MNHRERFKAVVRFETPDYVPLFGFEGAPGISHGCMKPIHDRLVAGGMPAHVGGCHGPGIEPDIASWHRYWGTISPARLDFSLAWGAEGFKTQSRIEDGFEIVESENGAITRQVVDNDTTYSMPQFVRYPVRDRDSWELYRQRMTPRAFMSAREIKERAKPYQNRTMPLCIGVLGPYAVPRDLMGPEALSIALYEDPALVHDIIEWQLGQVRQDAFPLIERLSPEIVAVGEDLCYNHGMMLSPRLFEEFCAPFYRQVCGCAEASGVGLVAVDTDGNAAEFVDIAVQLGVNGLYPFEVKAGNDLFALRARHLRFVCFGWLEKELLNEGNEDRIEPEIRGKVPRLLRQGGYFPNADHGIQPLATFPSLRRFMTTLHEVCGNPEGEFPRC